MQEFEKTSINYEIAYDKNKQPILLMLNAYCKYKVGKTDDANFLLDSIKKEELDIESKKKYESIINIIRPEKVENSDYFMIVLDLF